MMRQSIQIWRDPTSRQIGPNIKAFLCNMKGPTWIDIPGQDPSRTRVLVTLLHGNEPSGVKAVFHWLRNPTRQTPQTNLSIFICSVEAALTEPDFSHRYMPGAPDMNRCFRPPFDSENGKIARQVIRRIKKLKPEAVVDMHNTSGSGPDFAVSTTLESDHMTLAGSFSRRLILTGLSLGALMEVPVGCPIITLECGGSFDLSADRKALEALETLATTESLFLPSITEETNIYRHPLRCEVKPGATLTFADQADPAFDVTLTFDIEKHNFGVTAKGELLGWVGACGLEKLSAIDDRGVDITPDLFTVADGEIRTAQALRLFMITPRPEIATRDCLFYLVKADV